MTGERDDPAVRAVAAAAVALVADGMRLGLGSGRASSAFIVQLGIRVRAGLRVSGVATSNAAAALAVQSGVPLIELGPDLSLDMIVDGADEVAPNLDLVKGWGGALVRERIVTAASKRQIILVDESKRVQFLGERGRVPLEVIPLARWLVCAELARMGIVPAVRVDQTTGLPAMTDNGNFTIDCALPQPLPDAPAARLLERTLKAIVGVVDTGLFLGTVNEVLVGHSDGSAETLRRPGG